MSGMFGGGSTNPYDDIVNQTTDENLTTENWELILNLCDKVTDEGSEGSRNVIASILKRLAHRNPNVQLYALSLVEALSKNCDGEIHKEIASKAFTQGLEKLITDRNTHDKVRRRALELIAMWTDEFKSNTQLGIMEECYNNLRAKNYKYERPHEPPPPQVDDEIRRKEEEELQRVLEMSMQDKGGRGAYNSSWDNYGASGSGGTSAGGSGSGSGQAGSSSAAGGSSSEPAASYTGYGGGSGPGYVAAPERKSSANQDARVANNGYSSSRSSLTHGPTASVSSIATSQTSSSTATAAPSLDGPIVTRVKALHTFEPSEPGELGFQKGDIIKVVDRGYKDWWRGQLRGRTGIFPVNYVEAMPEPTASELAREAEQEAAVFSQAVNVEKLLTMLRALDPQKDNLADNEEIQELYRSSMALRPKIVKLIDKYSQKRADLVSMNETFVRARSIFDQMMEESLARHTGVYDYRQPGYPGSGEPGPRASVVSPGPGGYGAPPAGAWPGGAAPGTPGGFPHQFPTAQAVGTPVAGTAPGYPGYGQPTPQPQPQPYGSLPPYGQSQTASPQSVVQEQQQQPTIQQQQPGYGPQPYPATGGAQVAQDPQQQPIQAQVQPQVQAQTQPLQASQPQQQTQPQQQHAQTQPLQQHAQAPIQQQEQQQQQQVEGPPYIYDPKGTYADPNVQAWAQYYAQGGKDTTGSVYFISVPGVKEGPPQTVPLQPQHQPQPQTQQQNGVTEPQYQPTYQTASPTRSQFQQQQTQPFQQQQLPIQQQQSIQHQQPFQQHPYQHPQQSSASVESLPYPGSASERANSLPYTGPLPDHQDSLPYPGPASERSDSLPYPGPASERSESLPYPGPGDSNHSLPYPGSTPGVGVGAVGYGASPYAPQQFASHSQPSLGLGVSLADPGFGGGTPPAAVATAPTSPAATASGHEAPATAPVSPVPATANAPAPSTPSWVRPKVDGSAGRFGGGGLHGPMSGLNLGGGGSANGGEGLA